MHWGFTSTGWDPGITASFASQGTGTSIFRLVYNGKWGLADGNWKRLSYSSNRWYSLKVEARGDTFRAYLDGVLQFEQTDPRFTHGRICLFTWNAAARFRRIKVSDPQGNVLFEGLPELPPASNNTTPKANIGNSPRLLTAGETAAKSAQQQWAERLKTPVISTNSLGMKLALIPPGEFQMGSPKSERQRSGNEQQHRVRITKPFYLGVYEITQSEFEQVMGRNPSDFSNSGGQAEAATGVDTSRYPVENVTWYEAIEFCNKLSREGGAAAVLPARRHRTRGQRFDQRGKSEHRGGRRLSFADGSTMGIRLSGRNDNPLQLWDGQQWRRVQLQWQSDLMGPRNKVRRWAGPSRSAVIGRMHSDCTTCTATCGNGAGTCTMRPITRTRRSPIRRPSRTAKVIRKKSKTKNSPESDPAGPSGGSHRDRSTGAGLLCQLAVDSRAAARGWSTPLGDSQRPGLPRGPRFWGVGSSEEQAGERSLFGLAAKDGWGAE